MLGSACGSRPCSTRRAAAPARRPARILPAPPDRPRDATRRRPGRGGEPEVVSQHEHAPQGRLHRHRRHPVVGGPRQPRHPRLHRHRRAPGGRGDPGAGAGDPRGRRGGAGALPGRDEPGNRLLGLAHPGAALRGVGGRPSRPRRHRHRARHRHPGGDGLRAEPDPDGRPAGGAGGLAAPDQRPVERCRPQSRGGPAHRGRAGIARAGRARRPQRRDPGRPRGDQDLGDPDADLPQPGFRRPRPGRRAACPLLPPVRAPSRPGTPFDIRTLDALPRVDISYAYADADGTAVRAFAAAGAGASSRRGSPPA